MHRSASWRLPFASSRARLAATATPLRPFLVERYEGWSAPHSLSSSEIEPVLMSHLLDLCRRSSTAEASAALQRWDSLSLGYPDQPGSADLRAAIASRYERVDPSQVHHHGRGDSTAKSHAWRLLNMQP